MPLQIIRIPEVPVTDQDVKDVQRNIAEKVNRFQDGLSPTIAALEGGIFVGARRMTSVPVGTGSTPVFHRLGRVPVGWLVVRKTATCDVWETGATTADVINLIASVAVTVDLLVF